MTLNTGSSAKIEKVLKRLEVFVTDLLCGHQWKRWISNAL
jgi:hypothetical protein